MDTGCMIKLEHYPDVPDQARIDSLENIIIVWSETLATVSGLPFPYADVLRKRMVRLNGGNAGKAANAMLTSELPNAIGTCVALSGIKESAGSFELLTLARKLATAQLSRHPASIALYLPGLSEEFASRMAEALLAALLAGAYALPHFKSKQDKPAGLQTIQIFGLTGKPEFRRTFAEAAGNNLARHLTALPPNVLTPTHYREQVAELAQQYGWRMKFLDSKALRRKKAGAFLAVSQGSPVDDAGIVHLHYEPDAKSGKPTLALIGKGICFDTGGTNLKPPKYMYGMHEDMEGSAVALGILLALTDLQVDFPIDCWLALAQNHIGPNAYKQNDVVTASNGVTIEIMHTDAEGRMVLADTLALAARLKPALMLDYATLTGSCVNALGTQYSGAFTNRAAFLPAIIKAGSDSGERVWPFPTDSDYDPALDSETADIKQCTLEGGPDHILAARFLDRFVDKEVPWIHIDLSSGNHKGGLAHIPTDINGFGVRFTLNLLLEQGVMQDFPTKQ